MSDVKKNKGLFARLFGSKSSRCCAMEFEEETAPEAESPKDHAENLAKEPTAETDSRDGVEGEEQVSGPT